MTLNLTQPQLCNLREIVQVHIEGAEEELSDLKNDITVNADEIVNHAAYLEELREIERAITDAME